MDISAVFTALYSTTLDPKCKTSRQVTKIEATITLSQSKKKFTEIHQSLSNVIHLAEDRDL